LKDEEYIFHSDCWEKKSVARSARNKRTHNGKSGRVRFPSDNLTKKELNAMNGKVESYRLNDPMSWKEFKAMPDDIKVTYIKLLREKFNCFDSAIAEIMGVNKCTFSHEIKRLGLGHGAKHGGYRTWDEKNAFYAWAYGVPVSATDPVEETPEVAEQPEPERQLASLEEISDPTPEIKVLPAKEENIKAIPCNGSMVFEGRIEDVLNSVSVLLSGALVHINIQWDVISEGE
jgi:hypothetical protein